MEVSGSPFLRVAVHEQQTTRVNFYYTLPNIVPYTKPEYPHVYMYIGYRFSFILFVNSCSQNSITYYIYRSFH